MSNITSPYNELFYAQNALTFFKKRLGMASRVNRSSGAGERVGDQIKMRRAGSFTAQTAPNSSPQALTPTAQYLTFDTWAEVKTAVVDNERALTAKTLIDDHIGPMGYALADKVDIALYNQFLNVPWSMQWASTFDLADLTNAHKILFDNLAPQNDGLMSLAMNSTVQANALKKLSYNVNTGAGVDGARTQGVLPNLYGFNPFATQNAQTFTSVNGADVVGALTASAAKGATTIAFNGVTISMSFTKGTTFTITGDSQKYAIGTTVASDGSGVVASATITPALKQAASSSAVITFDIVSAGAAKGVSLAFHRDAMYLGFAELPMQENGNGVKMATVTDESGISLRYRRWYDGDTSETRQCFDVLFGIAMINENLGVRIYDF